MIGRDGCLPVLLLSLVPGQAIAQGIEIDHKPVGCIVAGKYPKLSACFSPAAKLARSRVYFRPESGPANWYYVEMKTDQPCFAGILPKPKKQLVGQKILYYIDAFDQQFTENRTPDQAADVVKSEGECKKELPIAPIVPNATVAVFPAMPAGFGAAGLSTGAAVGIAAGGAAAVGGGVAAASSGGGGGDTTTTTTTPSGSTNPGQTTTTSTTTTTTTTTLAPATVAFDAVFKINPKPASGPEPLTVEFNMCLSQGESLKYKYDFDGDGVEDFRGPCRVVRTYTVSGISRLPPPTTVTKTYNAVMTVFEATGPGGETASETNVITVTKPAPSSTFGSLLIGQGDLESAPAAAPKGVVVSSQLDTPGASGQVMVNGASVAFAGRGRSVAQLTGHRGENRLEAQLVEGTAGGFWRFELAGTEGLQRGSLRVVAGDVALVTDEAIVFRLAGRPGERIVFTFRIR